MDRERIFLIGLSGAGKSTVGRLVAEQLGWQLVDTDAEVEAATGRLVPELFAKDGEAAFREHEQSALASAAARQRVVVATGGGAPTTEAARRVLAAGFTVWLSVSPQTAAARLASEPGSAARPLLAGDRRARLKRLLADRRVHYEQADAVVAVDNCTPAEVANQVVRLWRESQSHPYVAAMVRTPAAAYPIYVEQGSLARLGEVSRDLGLRGRAFIVTDDQVGPLFGETARRALEEADYRVSVFAIPAGEEHKTLETVASVYDWLIDERVERSDFVVCLGGGVVTDLGGFAAATCLRGIDFVHVPTTLLGMVDAAIGGKTGVDHPAGKNLIGAFVQPRAVVIDPSVLETLPERQRRAGWAEVIKHGLILDGELVDQLEASSENPRAMLSATLIARSVAIKAAVVSEDEREQGRRTLLNYGHTIGHAIEAATGFSAYLHGEAVAVGMRAAGIIAVESGLLQPASFECQQRLIRAYGLPERVEGARIEDVRRAMALDKKVQSGTIRWVLLEDIGRAVVRDDIGDTIVRKALAAVLT